MKIVSVQIYMDLTVSLMSVCQVFAEFQSHFCDAFQNEDH